MCVCVYVWTLCVLCVCASQGTLLSYGGRRCNSSISCALMASTVQGGGVSAQGGGVCVQRGTSTGRHKGTSKAVGSTIPAGRNPLSVLHAVGHLHQFSDHKVYRSELHAVFKQLAVPGLYGACLLEDVGHVSFLGGGRGREHLCGGEGWGRVTYRHQPLGDPVFSHEFPAGGLEIYTAWLELWSSHMV